MKNKLAVAVWISIAVILLAMSVGPLGTWMTLPAWLIIVFGLFVLIKNAPSDHPMREALIIAIPLGFALCSSALGNLLQFMDFPTLKNLRVFLLDRHTIGFAAIYFASCTTLYASQPHRKPKGTQSGGVT